MTVSPQGWSCTQCRSVSSCSQRAGVAVCEDGDSIPGDARQDVLGTVVADLLVVVDVALQHVFDPGNYTVGGGGGTIGGK